MSLIRFNPNSGLALLNRDVDRFFRGFDFEPEVFDTVWYPSVDVSESEQAYEVKAELPGLKKEDIKVTVEDNTLILKGERKEETETKKKNLQISERRYGKFLRSFQLPREVNAGAIKAAYQDGVLTVEIPKAEQSKPKAIEVA